MAKTVIRKFVDGGIFCPGLGDYDGQTVERELGVPPAPATAAPEACPPSYVRVSFRDDSQVPLGNSLSELEVYAPFESAPAPLFNSPPSVSITSPPAGASFTRPVNVSLAADAADSDGAIAYVNFLVNGSRIGTDTTVPYSVSWSTSTTGTYTLTARAIDNAGASATQRHVGAGWHRRPSPLTVLSVSRSDEPGSEIVPDSSPNPLTNTWG